MNAPFKLYLGDTVYITNGFRKVVRDTVVKEVINFEREGISGQIVCVEYGGYYYTHEEYNKVLFVNPDDAMQAIIKENAKK